MYQRALDSIATRDTRPPLDFVFSDQAIFGRVKVLENLKARRYFLYPHSGRPSLASDFTPMWRRINAEFVPAEGHRQVMRSYGHNNFIHVVGWHLCPIKEFRESKDIRNVLFAPIHPRSAEIDQKLNRKVFDILKGLDIQLTVRYIGSLADNGLEKVDQPNVHYTPGTLQPSTEQIYNADVVIGHQTFGYLAVASGVPTVMFGEDMITHLVPRGREILYPKNWVRYHHLMRYPVDILDGDPVSMLQKVARSNKDVEAWKVKMIGKPFDAHKFLGKVRRYL